MSNKTRDCKVISIINMKGGVGKTTLTKEIGIHLAEKRRKKVLLIDVDPQLNLTQSLFRMFNFAQTQEIANERIKENKIETVSNDVNDKKKILNISKASIERIFSSTASLPAKVEDTVQKLTDNLSIIPGEFGIEFTLRNLNSNKLESGIYDFIRKNRLREVYDYILIDCPPTYSSYTVAALKPSDFLIVPVKPEAYSILGLNMLLAVVESVVYENETFFNDKPLKNLGIVFTDMPTIVPPGMAELVTLIKESEKIVESDTFVFETQFKTNAAIKKKIDYAIDFYNSIQSKNNLETLVDEIVERIETLWKKK